MSEVKPPFVFRRYINGQERAEGIGIETVETLEEAMPLAVRLCPRRPSECAVLVLERLAPDATTLSRLRAALDVAEGALEPVARSDTAIGDEPGPFRFETGTGHRLVERSDLRRARVALDEIRKAKG